MARLKWTVKDQRRSGGSRENRDVFVSVVYVYAPTARATPAVKNKFNTELQDTLDKVPQNDVFMMLGDFNARVGVLKPDEDEWRGFVGKNGIDERNEAGEDLLQFCAMNQLTVMNTWFQKKNIYYGTWMHPATKCCRDVQVMRGATCWTDHKLVRAKLNINIPKLHQGEKRVLPFAIHKLNATAARDVYRCYLESVLLDHSFRIKLTLKMNWEIIKSCIVSAAVKSIGRGRRKWFEENQEELMALIEMKNKAHSRMLAVNSIAAKKEFRQQQRNVKKAVDRAKEKWIRKVALEGEAAKKDGRTRWECIRRLQ